MGHYDPAGWQRDNPFTGGRNEMSFFTKFILTIVVLLIGVLAYKYQAVILRFFVAPSDLSVRKYLQQYSV